MSFRLAARSLAQSPGYTAAAILILTLGIGVNTTVASVASAVFLAPPREVADPERLVLVNHFDRHTRAGAWSYPDFDFFRRAARASVLAAHSFGSHAMTAETTDASLSVRLAFVSDNYFSVLGVVPAAGRGFAVEEGLLRSGEPAAVASHGFWQRTLGGSPEAVGGTIRINGHPFTLVGVAPQGFTGLSPSDEVVDLWVPIAQRPLLLSHAPEVLERRPNRELTWLQVFGRLGPAIEIGAAQADLDAVSARLGEEAPVWAERGSGVELLEQYRFHPLIGRGIGRLLAMLTALAAVVLAIAVVNLALLLLARASSRSKPAGIRLALGATRLRIAREVLAECLLLGLAGGASALLVAFWSAGVAGRALPFRLQADFAPDLRVLAATLVVSLAAALLFGLLPALHGARTEALSVIRRGEGKDGWARLRDGLVVAQVALAIPLAAGAALFAQSFREASRVNLGFASEQRLVAHLQLSQHGYDASSARQFAEQARERLLALPGVEQVSSLTVPPFSGSLVHGVVAEGKPEDEQIPVELNHGGPEFARAMGMRLLAGRDFDARDRAGTESVAVVSQAAAERLWPGEDPLGRRLVLQGDTVSVVGVVANTITQRLDQPPAASVYLPALQAGDAELSLVVVTRVPPRSLSPAVERELRALDPRIAIADLRPLDAVVGRVLAGYRVGAVLVGGLAALALTLTAAGLYGVLAYRVARGQRRIGVQMALGASRSSVARAVLSRGLVLAAWGGPIGIGIAWSSSRLLQGFLFRVQAGDPWLLAGASLFVVAVIALASWLPAWRAARVDPLAALREG